MKNLIVIIWTSIGILACFLFVKILPYISVIDAAQNIEIVTAPTVSSEAIIINGSEFPDISWKVGLFNAKKFLRGGQRMYIRGSGANVLMEFYARIADPLEVIIPNAIITYQGKSYGGNFFTGEYYCGGVSGNSYHWPLDAKIEVQKLKQPIKHAEIDLDITIPPTTIAHNPDECKKEKLSDPMVLEIRHLNIHMDSELIYEWTGKGGPTYRL